MKSLTTGQRLRYARAALKQASTLLRDAAALGGGLAEGTRGELRAWALMAEESATGLKPLTVRCNRDLDEARKRRHARRVA